MIYVDHAATSFPKPQPVVAEVERFLREEAANPGRGGYRLVRAAEAHVARVRGQLARFVGGWPAEQMVFTYSATDGLNMAIKGVVRPGDRVIVDALAHNSVGRPLRHLADAGQIELVTLSPAGADGAVDPQQVADALAEKPTRLVVLVHVSNVLGVIEPVGRIGPLVRRAGALFLVDAAQSAGAVAVDVEQDCIDLLAFPGHKGLQGPPGTGGLWVGPRAVDEIAPAVRVGGTGGDSSLPTQPPVWPHWLEAGTHNTAGLAGLGAGLEWIAARGGADAVLLHERELIAPLIQFLADDGRFKVYGPPADRMADRVGLVSFNINGQNPADVAAILDADFDISVRAGLHCAPGAHRHVGSFPDGSVRVSVGPMNTAEELEAVRRSLERIAG